MSETPSYSRAERTVETVTAALALLAALPVLRLIVHAIAARIAYPGDLEWMEGATLVSAMRVRDGLPLSAPLAASLAALAADLGIAKL